MKKNLQSILPQAGPLLSYLKKLRGIRRGHILSRLGRDIFEHKRVKNIIGTNIAVAVLAGSFVPAHSTLFDPNVAAETIVHGDTLSLATKRDIALPVKNFIVNQGYHAFHPGIDFEGITGDTVTPVMAGFVSDIQHSRFAYGNAVLVDHGNGLESLYAHLSKITVNKGDFVDTFTKIGEVGSTGYSTGDHLHLEIRRNGYPINPLSFLPRN